MQFCVEKKRRQNKKGSEIRIFWKFYLIANEISYSEARVTLGELGRKRERERKRERKGEQKIERKIERGV